MMPTSPPIYPTPPWRGQPQYSTRRTASTRSTTTTTTTTTTTLPPSKLRGELTNNTFNNHTDKQQ
jgi:hypothetical protein